jgi:hypothetical protein
VPTLQGPTPLLQPAHHRAEFRADSGNPKKRAGFRAGQADAQKCASRSLTRT